jgi:hypothetical protein
VPSLTQATRHWRTTFVQALRDTSATHAYPLDIEPAQALEDANLSYELAMAYYLNTSLYQHLRSELVRQGAKQEDIYGLYNPFYRVVEFHATHTWTGDLAQAFPWAKGTNPDLQFCVERLWEWSNWTVKKQVATRYCPIFGDLFLKVAHLDPKRKTTNRRVFLQPLDARLVVDFDTDERGYLTFFRTDDQRFRRDGSTYYRIELWEKDKQLLRIFELDHPIAPDELDAFDEEVPLVKEPFEKLTGDDYVPIVHVPFKDIGELRGIGPCHLLKDKIDETNRMATRLHQILFRWNGPMWAHVGPSGSNANPLPPPSATGLTGDDEYLTDDDWVHVGEGDLKSLVPDLHYDEALRILNDQLAEIQRDAPELMYYRLTEIGDDLTSKTGRLSLEPAIQRVVEARQNLTHGLIRAQMMALSIMGNQGLLPEALNLGNFDRGDLQHAYLLPDVIPLTDDERSRAAQATGQAAVYFTQAGAKPERVLDGLGERVGLTGKDVAEEPLVVPGTGSPTNTPAPTPANGVAS